MEEVDAEELSRHATEEDLWIVIDGYVYDITSFVAQHPGGVQTLVKYAGKDGSKAFHALPHSVAASKILKAYQLGKFEGAATNTLEGLKNVLDFEKRAIQILEPEISRYYLSGAEDGLSIAENLKSWSRIQLRPRVLVDVSKIDMSVTILNDTRLSMPVFSAPTALLKMAHPTGECGVAKATSECNIGNILSTTATYSIEDVRKAAPDGYMWFQLYVYKNKNRTRRLVKRAEKCGYKAIVLTVDLPVLGNREKLAGWSVPDKYKLQNVQQEKKVKNTKNLAKAGDRRKYVKELYTQNLGEDLLKWLGSLTDLPIILKGILRGDDAYRICEKFAFVRGVIVSNHGGRQLDGAIAPVVALPDVVQSLKPLNDLRKSQGKPCVHIFVDGGIRRGRDIFKALAHGADAVLLGRPLIWGLACGGKDGVKKVLKTMRDELETCMQLCGTRSISEIDESFIFKASKL